MPGPQSRGHMGTQPMSAACGLAPYTRSLKFVSLDPGLGCVHLSLGVNK